MIVDIPAAAELRQRADGLLNLAFDIAIKLYDDQGDDYVLDADRSMRAEYWEKCQPALANALALIQQAHELYLKGRIAEVSPYLLIARDPAQWPKEGLRRDVKFAEFLTIGAAELPRLHDMVCPTRLDPGTTQLLKTVREQRNMFVHQGQAGPATSADIFALVLQTHRWIYPTVAWFAARAHYSENDQFSALYSSDHVTAALHSEFAALRKTLSASSFSDYLGVSPRVRLYACPHCRSHIEYGDPAHTAYLTPNTPKSTAVVCLVCQNTTNTVRHKCHDPKCRSTVHAGANSEWGDVCLFCGADENFLEEEQKRQEQLRRWSPANLLGSLVGEGKEGTEEEAP